MPCQCLAGEIHELARCNRGSMLMGCVIVKLNDAMGEMQKTPELILG
jgi:hypothetical protein